MILVYTSLTICIISKQIWDACSLAVCCMWEQTHVEKLLICFSQNHSLECVFKRGFNVHTYSSTSSLLGYCSLVNIQIQAHNKLPVFNSEKYKLQSHLFARVCSLQWQPIQPLFGSMYDYVACLLSLQQFWWSFLQTNDQKRQVVFFPVNKSKKKCLNFTVSGCEV